jgi:hypothetical protein
MHREPNRHALAASVALPALLLCLACGDSNKVEVRLPPAREVVPEEQTPDEGVAPGEGNATGAEASAIEDLLSAEVLSIDPLAREVGAMLQARCVECHGAQRADGGLADLSDLARAVAQGAIIPGSAATSALVLRMLDGSMPPPSTQYVGAATRGEIALLARFIDRLPAAPSVACAAPALRSPDALYAALLADVQRAPAQDRPFLRYVGLDYASNAGSCGAALERQRSALFKLVNSVSSSPDIHVPLALDTEGTLYRINLRDYGWNDAIATEDAEFSDAWLGLASAAGPYATEMQGPEADALKLETTTAVPFLPAHALVHAASEGSLYYALLRLPRLEEQLQQELGVQAFVGDLDPLLKRASFGVGSPRRRESIVLRTTQGSRSRSYWAIENEYIFGHTSIFSDPLSGPNDAHSVIFQLRNGLQAYALVDSDGTLVGEQLPDCSREGCNGQAVPVPRTLAGCHACHDVGLVPLTDQIRTFTEDNPTLFDNDTFTEVMRTFPVPSEFDQLLEQDSLLHLDAARRAGVRSDGPEPISLVHYQFELGLLSLKAVAAELGVTPEVLSEHLAQLDARLQVLTTAEGVIDRPTLTLTYASALCALHKDSRNRPAHCP